MVIKNILMHPINHIKYIDKYSIEKNLKASKPVARGSYRKSPYSETAVKSTTFKEAGTRKQSFCI